MNMTRTTKIVAAALAVITLGATALVSAQSGRHGFGGPHGFGRGFHGGFGPPFALLRQLDVTDAQREQIRGIVAQHKDDFQAIGGKLGAARRAQEEAISAIPADEGQVRARTTELAAVQADAAVLRTRVQAEIFQVLTPEQQEKAKTLRADRERRSEERRKERQERRQQRGQQRQGQPQPPQQPPLEQ